MKNLMKKFPIFLLAIFLTYCSKKEEVFISIPSTGGDQAAITCETRTFDYTSQKGCDGKTYPNPINSPYVIPFKIGTDFTTGLTNCSSSYHGSGQPDQYAFDFDLPVGTEFTAARGGVVYSVEESQSSNGGGGGNGVVINHGDSSFGVYLHSPQDGILVEQGDSIQQNQVLGIVGRSGLAGYPHLHFIVVEGNPSYPYKGIPVSFNNAIPADVVLESYKFYRACGE